MNDSAAKRRLHRLPGRAAAILLLSFVALGPIACTPRTGSTGGDDQTPAVLEKTTEEDPVRAVVRLEPTAPLVGDPVTLSLRVTAPDGVEVLMPEFGEALERFKILDYKPSQEVDAQGNTIFTQVYRLEPPGSGRQVVPPILIEFVDRRPGRPPAPEDLDAYELLTDPIGFDVRSVLPESAEAELKPPLGKLDPLPEPGMPLWPWLLALAVLAAVASPFVYKAVRNWQRLARRRSAYEIAIERLRQLLARPRPNLIDPLQVDRFFVALSGIVRRYLEDRFGLRAPEQTTEEFLAAAAEAPDLTMEHQSHLRHFLHDADMVKFAGAEPTEQDVDRSVQTARTFLEQTRENAPMIDVDETVVPAEVVPEAEIEYSKGAVEQ